MFSFLKGGSRPSLSSVGTTTGDETQRMPIYPQAEQKRQQLEINTQRVAWSVFLSKNEIDLNETWLWQYWKAESRIDNQIQKKIMSVFSTKVKMQKQMKELVRNGIPPELRGKIWYACSGAEQKRLSASPEEQYEVLLTKINTLAGTEVEHDIDKDLLRTFPSHPWLHSAEGLKSLREILAAYALRNPRVGYCQSMNYLTALLMFHMPDRNAFWVLASIIEDMLAPNYYDPAMVGSRVDQQVFQILIKYKLPDMHKVLTAHQTNLDPITCPWFLCMYINILPLYTVCRVWDSFMWEGNLVLFRLGLAMLHSKMSILSDAGADTMSVYMALKTGQSGPRNGSFELENADEDDDTEGGESGEVVSSTQKLLQDSFCKHVMGNLSRKFVERKRAKYLRIISEKDAAIRARTREFMESQKSSETSAKAMLEERRRQSAAGGESPEKEASSTVSSETVELTSSKGPHESKLSSIKSSRRTSVIDMMNTTDVAALAEFAKALNEGISDDGSDSGDEDGGDEEEGER